MEAGVPVELMCLREALSTHVVGRMHGRIIRVVDKLLVDINRRTSIRIETVALDSEHALVPVGVGIVRELDLAGAAR